MSLCLSVRQSVCASFVSGMCVWVGDCVCVSSVSLSDPWIINRHGIAFYQIVLHGIMWIRKVDAIGSSSRFLKYQNPISRVIYKA